MIKRQAHTGLLYVPDLMSREYVRLIKGKWLIFSFFSSVRKSNEFRRAWRFAPYDPVTREPQVFVKVNDEATGKL
jgi:hypothetical protein